MTKTVKLTIRVDHELNRLVSYKAKQYFGIPLATLLKVFLKAFVSEGGLGFYVGDENLHRLFERWLRKKRAERHRQGCAPLPGPRVQDILNDGGKMPRII